MVFLQICTALYDYTPQNDTELAIKEGEVLYIVETKNEEGQEDEWWRAKKKAAAGEEEEPQGLIPNNYVQPVGLCAE